MGEKNESAEKPGEALVSQFVSVLGLTDVILGGIAVYAYYLGRVRVLSVRFATTGHDVLDVALLIGIAAFVGKFVTLIAAVLMAVINITLRRFIYGRELQEALATYWTATRRPGSYARRPVEVAIAAIRVDSADRAKQLDAIRAHAIIAHGTGLLVIAYAASPSQILSGFVSSSHLVMIGIAFITLGILQQADRITQAISFMRVVSSSPATSEVTHGDDKASD